MLKSADDQAGGLTGVHPLEHVREPGAGIRLGPVRLVVAHQVQELEPQTLAGDVDCELLRLHSGPGAGLLVWQARVTERRNALLHSTCLPPHRLTLNAPPPQVERC